jgi:hypothetical protein
LEGVKRNQEVIDKIRLILENGCKMKYASKAGVREIDFKDGTVTDPMSEVTSYSVELSFDGKVLMRLFNSGPAGYLHYKRDGVWQGNNRSVWTEMTPCDPTIWAKEYQPPQKKVVMPIKEHIKDIKEFDSYESAYDFEATTEEAVVVLVTTMNTKILDNLVAYQTGRDLIVEIDGEFPPAVNELVARIKEVPNVHLVQHKVRFGLGRLTINAHNNVLVKYKRAFFIADDAEVASNAINLAFNLHTATEGFAASVYGMAANEDDLFSYKPGEVVNGYVLSSEDWDSVKPRMAEYKELFLTTKYESRPHHSIIQWLKELQIYINNSDVLAVMSVVAPKPSYILLNPRITRVGSPSSHAMDNRRKSFKEFINE